MFQKVLATFGSGAAKLDARLLDRTVSPGGPLRGEVLFGKPLNGMAVGLQTNLDIANSVKPSSRSPLGRTTWSTTPAPARTKYSMYSDADWAAGRAAVLENLLDRPSLYRSEIARTRWESAARENLAGELTRWRNAEPHHR